MRPISTELTKVAFDSAQMKIWLDFDWLTVELSKHVGYSVAMNSITDFYDIVDICAKVTNCFQLPARLGQLSLRQTAYCRGCHVYAIHHHIVPLTSVTTFHRNSMETLFSKQQSHRWGAYCNRHEGYEFSLSHCWTGSAHSVFFHRY